MTDELTGPELFKHSTSHLRDVIDPVAEDQDDTLFLRIAQVQATNANTAALVMLAGLYADAHGIRSRELEVWSEAIPPSPLVKCWGKEARRPQCAERHTDDCDYADPAPIPKPVKQEPTGPRLYVRHPRGKDGYVVEFERKGEKKLAALVQWHVPGVVPVWVSMDRLTVIHPDDVARCPNGQTGDECGSGENQCELCLEEEDAEGDEIERSMGLR